MSIRFDHVTKRFGDHLVLDRISFEISPGEIVFIIGKSGTGKSVTLKHMMGQLTPDEGDVWVGPFHVNRLTRKELYEHRKKCGIVFQFPALFDFLSTYDNIDFGIRDLSDFETRNRRILEKLRWVKLPESCLLHFPNQLSFGMQKRVSIARTLAPEPDILLMDEPTTGLDPVNTRAINRLIKEVSTRASVTCVVVSHDMGCALEIADRILVLDSGKVLALDHPMEIRKSRVPLIQDFLAEVV